MREGGRGWSARDSSADWAATGSGVHDHPAAPRSARCLAVFKSTLRPIIGYRRLAHPRPSQIGNAAVALAHGDALPAST